MLGRWGSLALATLALASCSGQSAPIRAAGSSTVYPFTKAVAEAFAQAKPGRTAPVIESTGTQPGLMRFCESSGAESFDVADASRRMKRVEFDKCQANGVREIIEIPIGLDGLALAESIDGPKLSLSRKDIYLALAASPSGKPNTAKTWKDVNPALPAIPILVLGPPTTSGTRDAFVELILLPGCLEAVPAAKEMKASGDPAAFSRLCRDIRTDGAYVVEGEDDTVIVKGLARDPKALGLFGYSYLEQNAARLRGVPIDGIAPEYAAISGGKYPGGRTLYLYVKNEHLKQKPELLEFLNLYASMWGPNGPLAKRGLIVMSESARKRSAEAIKDGRPLEAAILY
ncbi:MAG: substrate-binding domain-containing protein [Pseudomonadota bacterium]